MDDDNFYLREAMNKATMAALNVQMDRTNVFLSDDHMNYLASKAYDERMRSQGYEQQYFKTDVYGKLLHEVNPVIDPSTPVMVGDSLDGKITRRKQFNAALKEHDIIQAWKPKNTL